MKIDPQTIEQLNAINKKYIDAANNHDAAARPHSTRRTRFL
jgi:hypothetical protein